MEDTTAQSMNAKLMKAVELVNDVLIEILFCAKLANTKSN